ncbi:MAG: hypothetical protein KC800_24840 [Candidatus Eremiobacteraeota bacterium]|nr:hypothetical protein [Candidatus Eremiobacteraeota bacterium]
MAEVMVALMLLSVISLVLTGMIPATITGMHKAAMRTNASMVALNRMAELQQVGFGNVNPTSPPHEQYEVSGTEYALQISVAPAPLSSGGTMDTDVAKLVSVRVDWQDRNGPQKFITQAVFFKRI